MAYITPSRVQHIAALTDVTSLKGNLSLTPHLRFAEKKARFVPQIRLHSGAVPNLKYLTIREEGLHKTGDSHLLVHLAQMDKSMALDNESDNTPTSPNMGKRRLEQVPSSLATPSTPPRVRGGNDLVPMNSTATNAQIGSPVAGKVYSLNKALPPMPALRVNISPERRGVFDATDSGARYLDEIYPILKPTSPASESQESFKIASSLRSIASDFSPVIEHGTGIVVEGQLMDLITDRDETTAIPIMAVPKLTSKDGSPFARKPISSESKPTMTSSPSNEDFVRRTEFGVGPTLRFSSDAYNVIMGQNTSPHPPRSSSLPKVGIKSSGQPSVATRLSRPTAASAARASESKKSFLKSGKPSTFNKANLSATSVVASLTSTPSKKAESSIASSSLPKSGTVNSLKKAGKGLKSRFSSIIPGRRRYVSFVDEEDAIIDSDLEYTNHKTNRVSRLLTTYHNSGMKDSSTSVNVRKHAKGPFMGEMTEKANSDREEQRHERDAHQIQQASDNFRGANLGAATNRAAARLNGGDDQPPTPPPTRTGPEGHYGEDPSQQIPQNMSEEDFDRYLEQQLNEAEGHLNFAIQAANNGLLDALSVARVQRVIVALGNSIVATREAHIAAIALRAATSELIAYTARFAADVRAATSGGGSY